MSDWLHRLDRWARIIAAPTIAVTCGAIMAHVVKEDWSSRLMGFAAVIAFTFVLELHRWLNR